MTRTEILSRADTYVNNDRNTQYGEPEDAFRMIADLWSAYLDGRASPPRDVIDAYDVACMLGLMKVARMAVRPENPDSCIDLAGYAACAGEILSKINLRKKVPAGPPAPPPQAPPAPPPYVSRYEEREEELPRP